MPEDEVVRDYLRSRDDLRQQLRVAALSAAAAAVPRSARIWMMSRWSRRPGRRAYSDAGYSGRPALACASKFGARRRPRAARLPCIAGAGIAQRPVDARLIVRPERSPLCRRAPVPLRWQCRRCVRPDGASILLPAGLLCLGRKSHESSLLLRRRELDEV